MDMAENEALLTTKEVAEYLGMNLITISRWCKNGYIPSAKIGKHWRIKRSDLDKWFKGKVKKNGREDQGISGLS